MHGLPSRQLSFQQEQENHPGPLGPGEILSLVQETHRTQRD